MKFLISTTVPKFRFVLGNDTSHVVFSKDNSGLASQITKSDGIDVWICEGDEVTQELLDQWVNQELNSHKALLVHNAKRIPHLEKLSRGRLAEIQAISKQERSNESSWVVSVLQAAEKLYARSCAHSAVPASPGRTQSTVLVVGAGLMSLVAAEYLATQGFRVRVVDDSPDPRTCKDWTLLGATHGGKNARMFTITEADNYNEKGSKIYHNMRQIFRHTTLNGGWSVKQPSTFNAAENAWVNTFEQIPPWLANAMQDDIYYVNREAGRLWNEYMDRAPELFEGVSLQSNVLRLYAEEVAFIAAQGMYKDLGAVVEEFSLSEFLTENTGFSAAVNSDHLAGGFIAQGFTLALHSFVNKLISRIIQLGGEFTWDCSVERIQRNATGEVTGLESQLGLLQADNYVLSTGVTRNGLLGGTASENLVQGVLGIWLQIPNLGPKLKISTKIHRRGSLVEDINVTVSTDPTTKEDILIFGGGYGYVGLDYPTPECPEMQALFNELEEVARIYFPEGYKRAKEQGTLWPNAERKFCIRPFTCTGLGVFEDIPAAGGGHLIITGGNNTGGFAQAPAIARAVCRAVNNEYDPIHVLFHPCRSQLVTSVSVKQRHNHVGARPML